MAESRRKADYRAVCLNVLDVLQTRHRCCQASSLIQFRDAPRDTEACPKSAELCRLPARRAFGAFGTLTSRAPSGLAADGMTHLSPPCPLKRADQTPSDAYSNGCGRVTACGQSP